MGYMDEYNKLKKKKPQSIRYAQEYIAPSKKKKKDEEIAPVKKSTDNGATHYNYKGRLNASGNLNDIVFTPAQEKEDERKWFQKGLFEDGYDFGDVSKTVVSSVGDALENLGTGIIGMPEKIGKGLLTVAPYIGQSGTTGYNGLYMPEDLRKAQEEVNELAKKEIGKLVAKDWYDERQIAHNLLAKEYEVESKNNPLVNYGLAPKSYDDIQDMSVFGDKSDSLIQSAGQLGATVGLQAVGVPWWVTTGTTSFGSQMETALNEGAAFDEATGSALISAGAEILSEKLFGGIKFGGKTVGDMTIQPLVNKISNKVVRTLINLGLDATGEGAEEVVSAAASKLGTKLYKEENLKDILLSEESIDEYIESFIGGIALGGGAGSVNATNSLITGKDYKTGLTSNEEKVIAKEIENRIAEQETDGKKLTKKEKSAIEKQVRKDLEKGYISIDTIESALGGDTYKGYTSLTERKAELEKAIKEIEDMPYNSLTVKQSENLKAMREDLSTVNEHLQNSKGKLSENVFNLTEKDTFLRESYAEKERSGQTFTADTTQYKNEYARKTMENFINSGLMNNTNQAHEYADFAAKIAEDKQIEIAPTSTAELEQMRSDRIKAEKNGEEYTGKFNITADPESIEALVSKKHRTMLINMDSKRSLISLVGHEITHTMEGDTASYKKLQEALFRYAETKGELQSRRTRYESLYKGLDADIDMELTADLVGDYVMTDSDFIRNLSTEQPNLFKRIYEEIKYMFKLATAGSREARELERVKKAFEEIYRESTNTYEANGEADTQYSISVTDKDTIDFLENQEHITTYKAMQLIDGKLYPPMAAKVKDENGKYQLTNPSELGVWQQATEDAKNIKKIKNGVGYYTLNKGDGTSVDAAYNPYEHSSNLVLNDQFESAHRRSNLVTVEGIIPVSEMTSGYKAEYAKDSTGVMDWHSGVVAGKLKDNKRQVYLSRYFKPVRILPDSEVASKYKEVLDGQGVAVPFNVVSPSLLAELEKAGVEIDYNGSPMYQSLQKRAAEKYSLTDSNGKRLTKGQREYFKNSKARDENGNLMVVYHGSKDYGFTVFDTSKADDNMSLFFTNSKDMANSYVGDKSKLYETYLNLENPYIVDAKGHRWNQIRLGENTDAITGKVERFVDLAMRYDVEIDFALVSENLGSMTDSVDYMLQEEADNLDEGETSLYTDAEKAELRQLASEIDEAYENWDEEAHLDEDGEPMSMPVYLLDHKLSTKYTTRQIAKIAKEQGNDGVIIENVNDNGKFTDVTGIHGFGNVYIAFNPNQIKSVDNTKPTSDPDIRYSLSDDGKMIDNQGNEVKLNASEVGTHGSLMAIRNINERELWGMLELNGIPVPSIAITDPSKVDHSRFGRISVLFDKETINPTNTKNEVYDRDVWTSRFPTVEYEADTNKEVEINRKLNMLSNNAPESVRRTLYRYTYDMDDVLNRNNGEAGLFEKLVDDYDMKQAFLYSKGQFVENVIKTTTTEMTEAEKETSQYFLDNESELVNEFAKQGIKSVPWAREHASEIEQAYRKYLSVVLNIDDAGIENVIANTRLSEMARLLREANRFKTTGGITTKEEVDVNATRQEVEKRVNANEYNAWLKDIFGGIEKGKGIYNGKDPYTPSGNRRSFKALHDSYTLENLVKNMTKGRTQGSESALFGTSAGAISANMATRFNSIADIKRDEGRITANADEVIQPLKDKLGESISELHKYYKGDSFHAFDSSTAAVFEFSTKKLTENNLRKILKDYYFNADIIPSKALREVINDLNALKDIPTDYFEAKPQRAVGLDEVQAVVIPNDTDIELKKELSDRGFNVIEYDPNIEGDRQTKINRFDELKFSLGNVGEKPRVYGSYNIFAKDIRKDIGPTADNFEQFKRDYAPLTETEANLRDDTQIKEHYFLDDMTPEAEEIYNGTFATHAEPSDPFYERDIKDVGKRDVKAYMYEHPEVKPFFQQEAIYMLGELENSTKGERQYNDQLYYDTNGEMGFFGTTRETSDEIAYLLDNFHYTYKDIEKGLKAIIEDNGKENNAISKRIEFLLDERLRKGYTDFMFGDKIEPNQEYINLLFEKEIATYDDESWNNWLRNLTEDEINHLSGYDVAPTPKGYVAIEPEQPKIEAPLPEAPLFEDKGGQLSMMETQEAPKTLTRKALHENIINNAKQTFNENGLDLDEVFKNAKNLSTFATVDNIPQRVMEKALGYKEGQILSDITVNKVAQNETEGVKWLNSYTDRKNGLLAELSRLYNIKPGSKKSAAAQMYAEGFYVNENNEIIKYGDAELAQDFPNPKEQRDIKGLASDSRIRMIYDETLEMINASRTRNAYPEIPRLDNYFLHFRAMDDTFSKLGLPFNPNDIRAKDLPTDLNGVTADLKPGQPYFASAMHRTGKRTSFDLLGGLERYLTSAKNQIYHIDDIQTLRAIRNYIADTYGQANGLSDIDSLSEEEAQDRIERVYNSHLSTFAKFLNEEANILAGKTALIDRGLEGIIGRRGITFLNTVNGQVGSNMVGYNISSSLTNFLPVVQTFAKTNKADFVKAFAQTVSNKVGSVFGKNDGFAEQSPVMIRRKGSDRFYRTPFQKLGDPGYALMGAVDSISTELIARTKYNELTRKGMDSQQAHIETDKWVSRLMGDRSIGQMPQLYNSKMLGLVTKFQLEVRNQLDSQFYDTIQDAKVSNEHIEDGLARNAKIAAKVGSTFVQLAVAQHLFGKAFESVAGYNPSFDIIEVLMTVFGFDDEEDSEDTALDNIEQGFLALLEDLPYTSTFTGGRIPISSALPIEELVTGKDEYGNDKSRLKTLSEIAPYYILPGGYGQIKKTKQGLSMFDDDLPISGSYTDSGNLRFPIEDTPTNRIQAAIFGQWASENARDYFDNNRSPLKQKQIEEFIEVDLPIRDYWEYREGLSGLDSLSEKADYINSLDLPIDKKNILINNQADRKEPIDLTGFDDDFADFEEFDFAVKNPEKYEIAQKVGGYKDYLTYKEGMSDMKLAEKVEYVASLDLTTEQKNALINGETDRKEPIDLTGYENYNSFEEFEYAKENPGKHAISKAVGDYEAYVSYLDVLNDIRADKDSSGKTINGSAKEKKKAYIFGLNLDYGQKAILYRSLYDSTEDKNKYNADIVEYLDSRNDISWEEMKTILEELGMKVYSDGRVEW